MTGVVQAPLLDRCAAKIDFTSSPNGCWLWTGAKSRGYGNIYRGPGLGGGRAHRTLYELTVERVPAGLELDPLCRTPSCVNPDHLEVVTRAENRQRGIHPTNGNERKTHCIRGHVFDDANTHRDRHGRRQCRACRRADALRRYHARRMEGLQ